ncbi:MAG: MATE family efflux transporter [archaeon]|nr:MATE family efflux transporter [archaeon]
MEEETAGVRTLLGNPKKAIIMMAIPIAIANIVQSTNNIIDAVWVAGLGTAALAATGVLFPYFFILIGIGNGIGVGASQAIARRIGAKDKEGADRVAAQAFFLTLVAGLIISVLYLIALEPLLAATGAGDYLDECVAYGAPLLGSGVVVVFCSMFSGLLRAEGAAKRAMITQLLGAVLNIIFDPIFIYVLDMGVAGAAWATILSMVLSIWLAFYWYIIKKDTFIRIPMRGFRFNGELIKDILKVGAPASLEMILISLCAMATNVIVLIVDAENGVAIFTTGWRILDLLMIPAMSIGFALVPIGAAALGARDFDKMKVAYKYALKVSVGLSLVMMLLTLVIAPLMVAMFTYNDDVSHLEKDLTTFLRMCCVFLPFMAFGFPSASMFQALGKGLQSLCSALVMNLLRIPLCYIAAITVGTMSALCCGLIASEIGGSMVTFLWCIIVLRKLFAENKAVEQ